MRNILKNKKAGEKYLSIWWFFILAVITGGILIGVVIFESYDYNIKELEADVLATKIIDCVVDSGIINSDFLDNKFDIFEKCYINEKIINELFYFEANVYEFEKCSFDEEKKTLNCEKSLFSTSPKGNMDVKSQCEISEEVGAKNYAKCSERFVYVLDKNNRKLLLVVKAGSSQNGKKENIV